jgi:hypothetical protein
MERSRSSNVSLHGRDDLRSSSDGFDTPVMTGARPYVTTSYRGVIMRAITLVCACSLSIGAHLCVRPTRTHIRKSNTLMAVLVIPSGR